MMLREMRIETHRRRRRLQLLLRRRPGRRDFARENQALQSLQTRSKVGHERMVTQYAQRSQRVNFRRSSSTGLFIPFSPSHRGDRIVFFLFGLIASSMSRVAMTTSRRPRCPRDLRIRVDAKVARNGRIGASPVSRRSSDRRDAAGVGVDGRLTANVDGSIKVKAESVSRQTRVLVGEGEHEEGGIVGAAVFQLNAETATTFRPNRQATFRLTKAHHIERQRKVLVIGGRKSP